MRHTGCYEFYLKNKTTGETARVISNCLLNACMVLEWEPSLIAVDGVHETYGKLLEKTPKEPNITKTSDDMDIAKFCF